jgi:ADP-heptose:LPS heptosyltransferase
LNILVIRLLGLGDVANILIPAARIIKAKAPSNSVDVLTFGAGVELADLCPEITDVLAVDKKQWPDDPLKAISSFSSLAFFLAQRKYDHIYCLDTWFMPCFLATYLREIGLNVHGNFVSKSTVEITKNIVTGSADPSYFQGTNFLESTFENMRCWRGPWWDIFTEYENYARFFLLHCCSLQGEYDMTLDVEADTDLPELAQGKKIIAVSHVGSGENKIYKNHVGLMKLLEKSGFYVWSRFDGSQQILKTLQMLRSTDLVVTVATSTQWLAQAVGTPSLMIPGCLPPKVLGAELCVQNTVKCQYCVSEPCAKNKNYECMMVDPAILVDSCLEYLEQKTD